MQRYFGVRRYWRIFLNSIRASHGRTQILLSANIYVFLNIRVSHGRILGGSTQIFESTPQKYFVTEHYFASDVSSQKKKPIVQKNALRTYRKIGWRFPGQAGALFPYTATCLRMTRCMGDRHFKRAWLFAPCKAVWYAKNSRSLHQDICVFLCLCETLILRNMRKYLRAQIFTYSVKFRVIRP